MARKPYRHTVPSSTGDDCLNWIYCLLATGEVDLPTILSPLNYLSAPEEPGFWINLLNVLLQGELKDADNILSAVTEYVRPSTGLGWNEIFKNLGAAFPGTGRFEILRAVLDQYQRGGRDFKLFLRQQSSLVKAGIHPASIPLCGLSRLDLDELGRLLAAESAFVSVKDINNGDLDSWKPWNERAWSIEIDGTEPINGIVACGRSINLSRRLGEGLVPAYPKIGDHILTSDDLKIFGDAALTSIGDEMDVFGDLRIIGCPVLSSIGGGARIHGDLIIQDCPNLGSLPADLKVSGKIQVTGCQQGFSYGPYAGAANLSSAFRPGNKGIHRPGWPRACVELILPNVQKA